MTDLCPQLLKTGSKNRALRKPSIRIWLLPTQLASALLHGKGLGSMLMLGSLLHVAAANIGAQRLLCGLMLSAELTCVSSCMPNPVAWNVHGTVNMHESMHSHCVGARG